MDWALAAIAILLCGLARGAQRPITFTFGYIIGGIAAIYLIVQASLFVALALVVAAVAMSFLARPPTTLRSVAMYRFAGGVDYWLIAIAAACVGFAWAGLEGGWWI